MHVCGVFAAESNAACVGCFQTGNDAQQSGFAATRRAEQGHQLAGVNVEADITQSVKVAKLFVNVSDFDAHGDTF
jgi:hypothetical protein